MPFLSFVSAAALAAALLAGCSTPPAGAPRAPHAARSALPPDALQQRSARSAELGSDIALHALSMLDRGYRWGGKQPDFGVDCSGLVSHVYRQSVGIELRGSAADIARRTRAVAPGALQAGDLVFFNTLGAPSSHVGVYVGNGSFVHAANARSGVRVDRLSDRYYAARYEGARTLLD